MANINFIPGIVAATVKCFRFYLPSTESSLDRETSANLTPTSRKLQFVVVTQSTPAVFISFSITDSLFLSVSNPNIFLQEGNDG